MDHVIITTAILEYYLYLTNLLMALDKESLCCA
ncbi:hypothetical protein SAMN05421510_11182 [Nitrosomonas ureae]|uniref:Uncharacterized protein n=1 Tax=Nitrosomonas ureae TaxID=44577 RepID=A0A1H9HLA2_9PROT|nr:hypothetical protein C8R28_103638 [Nitrosomonas ureae]PXX11432.1 hypothetical protein C8R27_12946 [Nitrosomonas ureae]SDU29270.1 hypothetical protein SAMN05216406_1452 [Nitrosomonas ureae]SEQ63002.1 hypothetical protein SAMN05421510_11182 [Nitrosomonas ureae]SOD16716.1 hypothetical protein SAMN06297164_0712 [Nitrosomonas ureae]